MFYIQMYVSNWKAWEFLLGYCDQGTFYLLPYQFLQSLWKKSFAKLQYLESLTNGENQWEKKLKFSMRNQEIWSRIEILKAKTKLNWIFSSVLPCFPGKYSCTFFSVN